MSIKIASWNIEERLTAWTNKKRGTPTHILQEIARLNADVLVLPEAYLDAPSVGVDDAFKKMGYTWHDVLYDDEIGPFSPNGKLYFRVASKLPFESIEVRRWGGFRNMPLMTLLVNGQKLRIIPVHLDDRSEQGRQRQLDDIIPYINGSEIATIMVGDFNAMHRSRRSFVLDNRWLRLVAKYLPAGEVQWVVVRLADMAMGATLRRLEEETRLRDVDKRRRATTTPKMRATEWLPSIRLAQIDHMLVSPDIKASNFTISKDGGSDHRAISAVITIR